MEIERLRIQHAFWLAISGLGIAALLVFFLVWWKYAANDVLAIVGLFTSVIGTLVGAFFGFQSGAAGKENERQERMEAQETAQKALAALDPSTARNIKGM